MIENKPLDNAKKLKNAEETVILFEDDRVKIERIYSNGWVQPIGESFISDIDEFVTLESGRAELILDSGDRVCLKARDSYLIKRDTRHRVAYTDINTVWLTVFVKN